MKENKLYFKIILEWGNDENKQNTLILPGGLRCKCADEWNCAQMKLTAFLTDCKHLLQKRAFGSVAEVMETLRGAFVRLAADEKLYVEDMIWSPKVVANGKAAEAKNLGCKFSVIKRAKAHFSEDESLLQNLENGTNPSMLSTGTLLAGMALSGSLIGAAGGIGLGSGLFGGAAAWLGSWRGTESRM